MTRRWLLLTTTAVLLGTTTPRAAEPLERVTPATIVGTWEGVDRYYESHLRLLVRPGDDSRLQGALVVAPAHPDAVEFVFTIHDIEVGDRGTLRLSGNDEAAAIGVELTGIGSASEERGVLGLRLEFRALRGGVLETSVLAGGGHVEFVKSDGALVERLAAAGERLRRRVEVNR